MLSTYAGAALTPSVGAAWGGGALWAWPLMLPSQAVAQLLAWLRTEESPLGAYWVA